MRINLSNKPVKTAETCIRMYADVEQINACIRILANSSASITRHSKVMALAGNETRLKILYLLFKEKQLCVCDLSDILHTSVSAVSQHLRKLKDGRLVRDQKIGQTIFYSITEEGLETLHPIFIQITQNNLQTIS